MLLSHAERYEINKAFVLYSRKGQHVVVSRGASNQLSTRTSGYTSTVESIMRIVEWRNASHQGHLEKIQHVVVTRRKI